MVFVKPAVLSWEATGKRQCGKRYDLLVDGKHAGISVQHCGHPTALWPYTVHRKPEEGMFIAKSGHGFRSVADAKTAAEQLAQGTAVILPVICDRYHVAGRIVV